LYYRLTNMSVRCTANCIPLLIQQNINGSNFFNRSWAEFKVGLSDARGNYWLGNDLLHELTVSGSYKLRFDLQLRSNLSWYYAEYNSFVVSNEASNYMITFSGFSGNLGNAFRRHNGTMFTTYDRDNDPWSNTDPKFKNNCAVLNGGGFWWSDCGYASVNTEYRRGLSFNWYTAQHGHSFLQSTRMWLTC